jgi:Flp pilus assembly protein TadG
MRRLKLQTGSNIVEFAFVLPLLLILVFGIIDFAILLYDKAVITNAVREGARSGIAFAPTRLTEAQVQQLVTNYCSGKLITFGSVTTGAVADFTPNRASPESGDTLTVSFTYTYNYVLIGKLVGLSSVQLGATSVMRVE